MSKEIAVHQASPARHLRMVLEKRIRRVKDSKIIVDPCALNMRVCASPDHLRIMQPVESDLFVQINLASGFVEECCSLSDKLRSLLKSIAENDPANDIRCEASRMIQQVV
ncbi:hypothetical protein GGR95_002247 [Sulfitobacter undariae]|uniref:Uncharacterized protein n=1 Tax=Sulfitobacter undariae TaxID=1563671 RepID=A0A7W6E704_9RHOB|nr:hypothetical protein [Sulfitobacter undariae]MBB3994601.1 hypothetical protein [Sulfitobacter undariae]